MSDQCGFTLGRDLNKVRDFWAKSILPEDILPEDASAKACAGAFGTSEEQKVDQCGSSRMSGKEAWEMGSKRQLCGEFKELQTTALYIGPAHCSAIPGQTSPFDIYGVW